MANDYMVAPGKSISSRSGIINEYDTITVKKLGSVSIFEALKKNGVIVPVGVRPERTMTVDLRPQKISQRGVLPIPAKADLSKVEVIEPKIVKTEKTEMPDEKPVTRRRKNIFGKSEESEEPEVEAVEEIEETQIEEIEE